MVWQLWKFRVNRIQFVRNKVVKHETQFGKSCTISNHKGMSKKMNIKRNELAIFLHFDSQFDFVAIFVLKTKENWDWRPRLPTKQEGKTRACDNSTTNVNISAVKNQNKQKRNFWKNQESFHLSTEISKYLTVFSQNEWRVEMKNFKCIFRHNNWKRVKWIQVCGGGG